MVSSCMLIPVHSGRVARACNHPTRKGLYFIPCVDVTSDVRHPIHLGKSIAYCTLLFLLAYSSADGKTAMVAIWVNTLHCISKSVGYARGYIHGERARKNAIALVGVESRRVLLL